MLEKKKLLLVLEHILLGHTIASLQLSVENLLSDLQKVKT